jgi:ElaB/YqjD/DUF883 family membrane-anchored ribosome-binding protein
VNTEIDPNSSRIHPPKVVEEIARWAEESATDVTSVASEITDAARDVAGRATETAKDLYESAALKAGDVLETSMEYVRRNPATVVLGAVAFGAAIGYLLMTPRRKPSFGERYADDPLAAVREAILEALAPVAQRVHKGYDSARDGAEKVIDRVHKVGTGHHGDSFSDQIGRIGSNLKFW